MKSSLNSLCVFCGSSPSNDPAFIEVAHDLGQTLAHEKIRLVFGGGKVGLMGAVADAVMAGGGKVTGVIPGFLKTKEVAHAELSELIVVESMHERKMKMFELSEGFLALPGGFGTLEEIIEVLTWHQLGLHKFPVGFLNVNGFYDHLQQFFGVMEKKQLLKPENRKMALFTSTIPEMLETMRAYQAPPPPRF